MELDDDTEIELVLRQLSASADGIQAALRMIRRLSDRVDDVDAAVVTGQLREGAEGIARARSLIERLR